MDAWEAALLTTVTADPAWSSDADDRVQKELPACARNWHGEYRTLLQDPAATDEALAALQTEFMDYARKVSELLVGDGHKAFKQKEVVTRGMSGHLKLLHGGVFFKVARKSALFETPATAGKVLANEFRALNTVAQCNIPGLVPPLSALLLVNGFRVLALCQLPIGDKASPLQDSTLLSGSHDGGRSYGNDALDIGSAWMIAELAQALRLKEHTMLSGTGRRFQTLLAGDVEVHRGTDQRVHLIDLQRLLPPVAPRRGTNDHLVKQFRPEFLRRADFQSLCPQVCCFSADAYSGWGKENAAEYNHDVRVGTRALRGTCVRLLAAELDLKFGTQTEWNSGDGRRIAEVFHSHGANLRLLHAAHAACASAATRRLLLLEMVRRVLKQKLRSLQCQHGQGRTARASALAHAFAHSVAEAKPGDALWSAIVPSLVEAYFVASLRAQDEVLSKDEQKDDKTSSSPSPPSPSSPSSLPSPSSSDDLNLVQECPLVCVPAMTTAFADDLCAALGLDKEKDRVTTTGRRLAHLHPPIVSPPERTWDDIDFGHLVEVLVSRPINMPLDTRPLVTANGLLRGDLELAADVAKHRQVRLFVSSTFADTQVERNFFMRTLYPELRRFCAVRGADMSVVDLRWGVIDESTNDHMGADICLGEIEKCREQAIGPYFVWLSTNRYGWRLLPRVVACSEMEKILAAVGRLQAEGSPGYPAGTLELVQQWYLKDLNYALPVYTLKPIPPDCKDFFKGSNSVERRLLASIRGVLSSVNLTEQAKAHWVTSITHQEVNKALCNGTERVCGEGEAEHMICIMRTITDLSNAPPNAQRRFDTTQPEDKTLLQDLRERVPGHLPAHAVLRYAVNMAPAAEAAAWGLDLDTPDHLQYLHDVRKQLRSRLEAGIERDLERMPRLSRLARELALHGGFAHQRAKVFRGRADLVDAVTRRMAVSPTSEEGGKKVSTKGIALLLHGPSGIGKTSLMCKLAAGCVGDDSAVFIRCCGISPDSSNARRLLSSLLAQCHHLRALASQGPAEETADPFWLAHFGQDPLVESSMLVAVLSAAQGDEVLPSSLLDTIVRQFVAKAGDVVTCEDWSSFVKCFGKVEEGVLSQLRRDFFDASDSLFPWFHSFETRKEFADMAVAHGHARRHESRRAQQTFALRLRRGALIASRTKWKKSKGEERLAKKHVLICRTSDGWQIKDTSKPTTGSMAELIEMLKGFGTPLGLPSSSDSAFLKLAEAFLSGLESLGKERIRAGKAPACLFIDSIDQLTNAHQGRTDPRWLPLPPPPGVTVVLSCLPGSISCLDGLKSLVSTSHSFEVAPLANVEAEEIVEGWLQQEGRCLQAKQKEAIFLVATQQRAQGHSTTQQGQELTSLFLRLLYDSTKTWESFRPLSQLPTSVEGVIRRLLSRLEYYNGANLVKWFCAYLAFSRFGLSRDELLDLLSANEAVLTDVLDHFQPDQRRMAPLVLARLEQAFGTYVVSRGAGSGSTAPVLAFYHRQFLQTVQKVFPYANEARLAIANYFSGTTAVKYSRQTYDYRRIHEQPIRLSATSSALIHWNGRRLSELPAAWLALGELGKLEREMCSTEYVQAAYQLQLEGQYCSDLKKLLQLLQASKDASLQKVRSRCVQYYTFSSDEAVSRTLRADPTKTKWLWYQVDHTDLQQTRHTANYLALSHAKGAKYPYLAQMSPYPLEESPDAVYQGPAEAAGGGSDGAPLDQDPSAKQGSSSASNNRYLRLYDSFVPAPVHYNPKLAYQRFDPGYAPFQPQDEQERTPVSPPMPSVAGNPYAAFSVSQAPSLAAKQASGPAHGYEAWTG